MPRRSAVVGRRCWASVAHRSQPVLVGVRRLLKSLRRDLTTQIADLRRDLTVQIRSLAKGSS